MADTKTTTVKLCCLSWMSHYQHNINAPQFPGGVHMAHFSLANTTLIGQEVQQRLWEKYWGNQCPAVPTPLMWYQPEMCYHGYRYGVPTSFHAASTHNGFDQSRNPKLLQRNTVKSNNDGGEQTVKSHHEKDVLAELLKEQDITKTSKQKQGINSSSPRNLDPVTDDLNWNMFSSDLADGIVVSILDSFSLQLPRLDFTLVQSVLQQIDSNAPQPEVHVQQTTAKKGYFQDIVSLPQTQWQGASNETLSNKAGSTPNAKQLDCSLPLHTQKEPDETGHQPSKTRSSSGFRTIGKTILEKELCSAVPVSSTDTSDLRESVKSVVTGSPSNGKVA